MVLLTCWRCVGCCRRPLHRCKGRRAAGRALSLPAQAASTPAAVRCNMGFAICYAKWVGRRVQKPAKTQIHFWGKRQKGSTLNGPGLEHVVQIDVIHPLYGVMLKESIGGTCGA